MPRGIISSFQFSGMVGDTVFQGMPPKTTLIQKHISSARHGWCRYTCTWDKIRLRKLISLSSQKKFEYLRIFLPATLNWKCSWEDPRIPKHLRKNTDPLMDTIQKLVSHGWWLFGTAKWSPQWATLPVGRVCRNSSEESFKHIFFSGHVWMLFHWPLIFRCRDVSIYSSKLLRKTRLVPRKHFWLYHALPTPRSEHSKGSLSKRTKRIIDRQVLRRQYTPPTLPANSLFFSSRCGLVHSHHNCWHLYLD